MTDRKHPTLRDIRNKLIEGRGYEKDNNDTFSGLLVIPKSINEIEYNAFENVTGISEIQNLSNATVMLPRVVIKVTVRAKGDNYRDFATTTYKIIQKGIGSYKVSVAPKIYTGSKITLTASDITFKTKDGKGYSCRNR